MSVRVILRNEKLYREQLENKIFSIQILLISIIKFTRIDKLFFVLSLLLFSSTLQAQQEKINWLTFEQLDDSLKVEPKKTFIFFYADWCTYCKKMEQSAFKNQEIIDVLNTDFYAVKMDAESKEKIEFDGVLYQNKNLGKSRKPTHQIAELLASRKGVPFSLPVSLILDEKFSVKKRSFEYLSPEKLNIFLENK